MPSRAPCCATPLRSSWCSWRLSSCAGRARNRRLQSDLRNLPADLADVLDCVQRMGLDNPIHIAFLVVVLLLLFGAKRLPEIGSSLSTGMREFKQSVHGETPPQPASLSAAPPQQPPAQAPAAQAPVAQAPAVAAPVAAPLAAP